MHGRRLASSFAVLAGARVKPLLCSARLVLPADQPRTFLLPSTQRGRGNSLGIYGDGALPQAKIQPAGVDDLASVFLSEEECLGGTRHRLMESHMRQIVNRTARADVNWFGTSWYEVWSDMCWDMQWKLHSIRVIPTVHNNSMLHVEKQFHAAIRVCNNLSVLCTC
jgi:hypothetical protein